MSAPYDLWIQREPRISKAEWHQLVSTQNQLRKPKPEFGEFPEDSASKEEIPEFVWWSGSWNRLPTKIAFLQGCVHIEAADAEAYKFAQSLALALNATVAYG
jgi:hypothetical protein